MPNTISHPMALSKRVGLGFRLFASVLLLALATGCVCEPPQIIAADPSTPPARLLGIKDIMDANPGVPIRVLFVHGMGTAASGTPQQMFCDFEPLTQNIAATLGFTADVLAKPAFTCPHGLAAERMEDIWVPNSAVPVHLLTFAYHQNMKELTFKYIHWASLVDQFRNSTSMTEKGHPQPPEWGWLTRFAKDFMRTHFTDVVAYSGTFRQVMRPAIEQALCQMLDGSSPDHGKTCIFPDKPFIVVLVTHSLGGYMLADAVADLHCRHQADAKSGSNAATELMRRTGIMFMLANQLALLDISTQKAEPFSAGLYSCQDQGSPSQIGNRGALAVLMAQWHEAHSPAKPTMPVSAPARAGDPLRGLQLVGISDPNDILTYMLAGASTPDDNEYGSITNVYLGTSGNFAGFGSDPFSAHVNYLSDSRVSDIVTCGMHGSRIGKC